jgi:MFS family permease
MLCAPLIVFCPVLVTSVLHRGVNDFSASIGAFGAGGLLGAIVLLDIAVGVDRRRISSWCARGYGAIVILAALNPWFWGLPVLLAGAGALMTISNTSVNALLQAAATPKLRGQTISLYMVAMRGGASFGSLGTGLSLSVFGVREALLVNGVLAIVAQIAVGLWWFGALRRDKVREGSPD